MHCRHRVGGPSSALAWLSPAEQSALSRIWGGIHPPLDDVPGRLIGIEVGNDAYDFAASYFD